MPNPLYDKASDWEIASLGGVALARWGGAGLYFFVFRSKAVGALEPFCLSAAGIGLGGNQSGFNKDDMSGLSFSDVDVKQPFSLGEIHLSGGTLVSAALGYKKIPINFGWSRLDAVTEGKTFFVSSGTGTSLGSSYGILAFAGTWYSYYLNNNSINPLPAMRDSIIGSVENFAHKIYDGINNLQYATFPYDMPPNMQPDE